MELCLITFYCVSLSLIFQLVLEGRVKQKCPYHFIFNEKSPTVFFNVSIFSAQGAETCWRYFLYNSCLVLLMEDIPGKLFEKCFGDTWSADGIAERICVLVFCEAAMIKYHILGV